MTGYTVTMSFNNINMSFYIEKKSNGGKKKYGLRENSKPLNIKNIGCK